MRTKSKYRRQQYRDGGRVDLPGQELPIEPPTEQPVEAFSTPPAPVVDSQPEPPAPQPQPEQPPQNDATEALHRQIEALKKSEQVQRQRAAMPQQPMSREARLAAWQAEGISPAEVQFFQNHPAMVDHPQVTGFAVHKAIEAGLVRDTDPFFAFVEKAFDAQVEHMMQQQAPPAMQQTPTPKFFAPPPGPPGRSAPNPSARFSAPVSRDVPSGGSGKRHTPGKVTLTPSEVEAARVSGVSLEEYAKNKIEYQRQREAGEYRDNREQR